MYAILLVFPSGKQMQRNFYEYEKHGKVNMKIAGLKTPQFFYDHVVRYFYSKEYY